MFACSRLYGTNKPDNVVPLLEQRNLAEEKILQRERIGSDYQGVGAGISLHEFTEAFQALYAAAFYLNRCSLTTLRHHKIDLLYAQFARFIYQISYF